MLAGSRARFCAAVVASLIVAAVPVVSAAAVPGSDAGVDGTPWPMHPIDSRYRGANALGRGDVNGDGLTDYVTNYEFDHRYVVEFHPPPGGDVRGPWPTVDAYTAPLAFGHGVDSENAALADLDGDGNLDVVGGQGRHNDSIFNTIFWTGAAPGVHVIWGPPAAQTSDASAWTDGGMVPATVEQGHFLWVFGQDVDGDGATDIVAGGRVQGLNGKRAGVQWLQAPAEPSRRRDLSAWARHDIDPDQLGGHGLVPADVDADGDTDYVLANADFDTPDDAESVLWYENPGAAAVGGSGPWARHVVYRGPEFSGKPQVAVADLDGDGLDDLVTSTDTDVYWFRKTSVAPVAFDRVVIPKPPETRWFTRSLKVADVDGDGRLDIFGMLVHEEGDLPADKAAAFWMSYDGAVPAAGNWHTHVVKWGSGRTMLIPSFGEKWDNADLVDVDGDGDLDVVANDEEQWAEVGIEIAPYYDWRTKPESVAVVWFENRLDEAPFGCAEADGRCVVEAEHATSRGDDTWVERGTLADSVGNYVQAHDALNPLLDGCLLDPPPGLCAQRILGGLAVGAGETRGATYHMDLAGGTYAIWLRRFVPYGWGYGNGGMRGNSAWLALDSGGAVAVDDGTSFGAWTWVRAGTATLAAGGHDLALRVRERGYAVDRMMLTSNPDDVPSGDGPAETP